MSLRQEQEQPAAMRRPSPRARAGNIADRAATPFFQDDEPTVTVLRMPGEEPKGQVRAPVAGSAVGILQQLPNFPERVLVRAAAPLLLMIAQIRGSIGQADIAALRRTVMEEIDRFQQAAQNAGIVPGDVLAARYVLCAAIDETVLTTPWGSSSEWSVDSLLNHYHNETWGGEKVYSMLDWVRAEPEQKLPLIILMHTCLMLGFEGRYRVIERGRDELEDRRTELSRLIKRYSAARADEPLSRIAHGERGGRNIRSFVPLWAVGAGAAAMLLLVNSYIQFQLSGAASAALTRISSLISG